MRTGELGNRKTEQEYMRTGELGNRKTKKRETDNKEKMEKMETENIIIAGQQNNCTAEQKKRRTREQRTNYQNAMDKGNS